MVKKKAVLFIHGFLSCPNFFARFIPEIPSNYEVYNILLDGHGGTLKDFSSSSMAKWKTQVRAKVSELLEEYDNIIIVAHSMGTFFAIEAAVDYSEKVREVFLLGVPLKIFVKPAYFINGIKFVFNLFPKNDRRKAALECALGVDLNRQISDYVECIPRCVEVLKESARCRKTIKKLKVSCKIFQSRNDEVVSIQSMKYIPYRKNIEVSVLEDSSHFMYSENDFKELMREFKRTIK